MAGITAGGGDVAVTGGSDGRQKPGRLGRTSIAGIVFLTGILAMFVGIAVAPLFSGPGYGVQVTPPLTFAVAFLVGTTGALVYLAVLLATDAQLTVLARLWENPRLSAWLMVPLFLISGGLVASMAQVSAGGLTSGDVWGVFLTGFGWLGAMSGVGGSTAAKTSAAEADKTKAESKVEVEGAKAKAAEFNSFIDDMKSVYEKQISELRARLETSGR